MEPSNVSILLQMLVMVAWYREIHNMVQINKQELMKGDYLPITRQKKDPVLIPGLVSQ